MVAALAGDGEAARDVQLDLPETGVCSSNVPLNADLDSGQSGKSYSGGCYGTPAAEPTGRGLATSISGGLLRWTLTLIDVSTGLGEQANGCCS